MAPPAGARPRVGFGGARRRIARSFRALLALATLAPAAHAQGPERDFNAMALEWSRGRWASPVLCEIGGEPVRGVRRVLVAPGPRQASPAVNQLIFRPLEADEASRCFTSLGAVAPDVSGTLRFRHERRVNADAVEREFKAALRREDGFDFRIVAGTLRIVTVGEPASGPREVDFAGGRARFREVAPRSDTAKLLVDFESPRKLSLELEANDGTRLELPLALAGLR